MGTIYLDHCATTPVRAEVRKAMLPFLGESFGNPSSTHGPGRYAREALETARQKVAGLIGADASEIVFTSGGTEAINLALQGVALSEEGRRNHIITSSIEHHAVLNTCLHLKTQGFKITRLPVDRHGLVAPDDVRKAMTKKTCLVTIMHANNEIGTIQPINDIGRIARENGVFFHADAVQTAGMLPLNVVDLPVDFLSLSGHKLYGPKGVGALFVRKGRVLRPLIYGGHQEQGLRGGTENVAAAVGFGRACELAALEKEKESRRLRSLRDRLQRGIAEKIPAVRTNGHPEMRLPQVLNISIPGLAAGDLVRDLDRLGIAASAGSACTSHSIEISHVLSAIGISREWARGTIRLSLGRSSRAAQMDRVAGALASIVERQSSLSELERSLGSRRCY